MAKTAEEVLQGIASTIYKLDEQGVTALKEADGTFKDDAPDFFIKMDAERVAALRGDVEKIRTDRYSQGKREAMEELEKKLKEEYGIKEGDKRGIELVRDIVAAKMNANGTLNEDKVKAHPLYLSLEEQLRTAPTALQAALDKQKTELESGFKREANYGIATKRAQVIFEGMKPVLPKNAEVASNQRALLDAYVREHTLDFADDGKGGMAIVPMKADGSGRLEDGHGHPITFDQLVQQGAKKFFEFQASDDKAAGTDPNKVGGGSDAGGQGGSYDPKTTAEYVKLWEEIKALPDPKERTKQWALLKTAGVKNGVAQA